MPPIPIYSHSPINAAKAAGATPQTTEKAAQNAPLDSIPPTTTTAVPGYPPAQPGASPSLPSLPAPTGSVAQSQYSPIRPTPTQPPPGSQGPPPPQPGAVPVPPGGGPPQTAAATATATSTLPPPPRAGEPTAAPQQAPGPPQMHIPPPSGTSAPVQAAQRGTTTATTSTFEATSSPLEHPSGYQQNVHAGEMDRYQRARQDALEAEERSRSSSLVGGGDGAASERVWGSAKKALMAAGEKLAGAEQEVWKRINKE